MRAAESVGTRLERRVLARSFRAPGLVLLLILLLAGSAVSVLALDALTQPHQAHRSATFQHLVGGLGFGPALDLSRCACSFDPRVAHACSQHFGPIPCGHFFCPQHAGSIFYYPELEPHAHLP